MAVLIPALDSRVSRKTPGVRRLAERLAHKRDSGYLPWYCAPTGPRNKQCNFKSVGIQAQGRTAALKTHYRNTKQILQTASLVAADPLTADDKDDDGIPLHKPVDYGRDGQARIIKLPSLRDEAAAIADHLASAHQEGFAWGDMAVLYADTHSRHFCALTLAQRKLPVENRIGTGDFDPTHNKIKVITMKVSKGLEFPVVALPGMGHMPAAGQDEQDAARFFV